MTQHGEPGVGRTNPGWYPDPSWPKVVRWWNGKDWTRHTAPNDHLVARLRAPRGVLRTIVLTVVAALAVLSFVGLAYVIWLSWALSQWSSNK